MDYTRDAMYFSFLIESAEEERRLINAINESFIVCEGTNVVPRIAALHEGKLLDGAKAKLDKFIEFIKKLWNKFIENMNSLFLSGVKYLEKYKDVILNRKPIDSEWELKRYHIGLERIASDPVIAFTPDLLTNGMLDSEEAFQKRLLTKSDFRGTEDFASYCKDYFTGGGEEVKIQANQLNFTDMYNFCHDKKNIYNNVQKDYDTIATTANVAYTIIKQEIAKIDQEARKAQAAANQQAAKDAAAQKTQSTPQSNTNNQAEAKPAAQPPATNTSQGLIDRQDQRHQAAQNASAVYSDLYGGYITEAPSRTVNNSAQKTDTQATSGGSNGTLVSATRNNVAKATPDSNNAETMNNHISKIAGSEGASEDKLKEINAKVDIYNKCSRIFLAAKMTAIDSAYNDYMFIIKTHVRDQLGQSADARSDKNQQAQAGTEYQTGSNEA